jgi:hypothetical protein
MEDFREELKIVPKFIFKNWDWKTWTGLIWLRIGKDGGLM